MWIAKDLFRFSSTGCPTAIFLRKSTRLAPNNRNSGFSCGAWTERLDVVSCSYFSRCFSALRIRRLNAKKRRRHSAASAGITGFRPEISFSLFIVSPPGSDVYGLFKRISRPLGASFCQQRRRCPLLNDCLFRNPLLSSRTRLSYTS